MTLFPILLFEKNQGVSIGGVQLLSKQYESQQLGLVIKPELKINPNSVDVGTILNIGFKYDLVLIPDRIFNQLGTDIKVQRQSLIGIGL